MSDPRDHLSEDFKRMQAKDPSDANEDQEKKPEVKTEPADNAEAAVSSPVTDTGMKEVKKEKEKEKEENNVEKEKKSEKIDPTKYKYRLSTGAGKSYEYHTYTYPHFEDVLAGTRCWNYNHVDKLNRCPEIGETFRVRCSGGRGGKMCNSCIKIVYGGPTEAFSNDNPAHPTTPHSVAHTTNTVEQREVNRAHWGPDRQELFSLDRASTETMIESFLDLIVSTANTCMQIAVQKGADVEGVVDMERILGRGIFSILRRAAPNNPSIATHSRMLEDVLQRRAEQVANVQGTAALLPDNAASVSPDSAFTTGQNNAIVLVVAPATDVTPGTSGTSEVDVGVVNEPPNDHEDDSASEK